MNEKETGGPAFPYEERTSSGVPHRDYLGMTLRQYAAIKLRVPDSGTVWLDEMIAKSLHNEFAAKALQGMLADTNMRAPANEFAERAYALADAMLEARK